MRDFKPIVHEIDPTNFKHDVEDPRLAALFRDGYVVVTSAVLEDPRAEDEQRIALVLAPPRPSDDPNWNRYLRWGIVLIVFVQLLQLVALIAWVAGVVGG